MPVCPRVLANGSIAFVVIKKRRNVGLLQDRTSNYRNENEVGEAENNWPCTAPDSGDPQSKTEFNQSTVEKMKTNPRNANASTRP